MKITKAITNCQLVLENGILWDATLLLSDNKIASFGEARVTEIPEDAEIIDTGGNYVGPGFVDIHVHGGGGYQTSTHPVEAAEHFLRHGETSLLCTPSGTGSKPLSELVNIIHTIRDAMKIAKNIKGIHMEGPYYNPNYGANKKINTWGHKPIVKEDFIPLVDAGGTDIKNWMIAPERVNEGLMDFLKYAREVNPDVIFSVGHSEATPAQIRALGKYRPANMTHITNATGRLPAPGGTRSFGPDEYALKEPEMYAELISDSLPVHVPADLQRYVIKGKTVDKVILITDSTVYPNPPRPDLAHVTDINFDDWGGIAGSKLTMDVACRNIMKHTSCGITEAFIMASRNPARLLGLDDEIGTIEVGKTADLVIVNDRFDVKTVILGGEVCSFKEA